MHWQPWCIEVKGQSFYFNILRFVFSFLWRAGHFSIGQSRTYLGHKRHWIIGDAACPQMPSWDVVVVDVGGTFWSCVLLSHWSRGAVTPAWPLFKGCDNWEILHSAATSLVSQLILLVFGLFLSPLQGDLQCLLLGCRGWAGFWIRLLRVTTHRNYPSARY